MDVLFLNIYNCMFKGEELHVNLKMMELLGNYPVLQFLYLRGVELGETGETLICRSNSFLQLTKLYLQDLPNLKKWEVKGAMPQLTWLDIHNCPNLDFSKTGYIGDA